MKRQRTLTLRSFFALAITPVIPAQENVNINPQQSVETGASIDTHIDRLHIDAPILDAPVVHSVDTPMVNAPSGDAPVENNVDDSIETPATNEELVFDSSKIVADPGL